MIDGNSISITNLSYQGFTISVNVTDNVGVSRVRFPVWTPDISANGTATDDLVWHEGDKGRPRREPREMLNGIFWIARSGASWRDLPERYGPWQTVYKRFKEWLEAA